MPEFQLSQLAQHWVNMVLIWVGFGALAGLLARALIPSSRPVPTLVLGIVGSMLGLLILSLFFDPAKLNPISPLGLLSATAAAFGLLMLYRLFMVFFPDS